MKRKLMKAEVVDAGFGPVLRLRFRTEEDTYPYHLSVRLEGGPAEIADTLEGWASIIREKEANDEDGDL